MSGAKGRLPAVLLAAVGLLISGVLEWVHVHTYLDPASASFCAVGETFDCDSVALSRFSVLLGIPMPVWGIAGFAGMLAAAVRRSRLLLPLAGFSTVASIGLFFEQLLHVGAFCLMCEAVHLAALGLLILAWRDRKNLAPVDKTAMVGGLVLPALIVAVSWITVPPYWTLVSWKSGIRFAQGVDEEGRPWIGAENPTVTVTEFVDYGCPHCAIATGQMRLELAKHPDTIRLVRHHQPRMRCRLGSQCQYARAAMCAGEQGKFWEMDDWLFRHAPGQQSVDFEAGAKVVGLDYAALTACMDKPETYEAADAQARAARELNIRETPGYVIDGTKMTPAEAHAELARRE